MWNKLQKILGINIKLRAQNIYYILTVLLSIILPMLTANGMELSDLNSWQALGDVFKTVVTSPYVLLTEFIAILNATVNFDSKGLKDNVATLTKTNIKDDAVFEKDILIGKLQEDLEALLNECGIEEEIIEEGDEEYYE